MIENVGNTNADALRNTGGQPHKIIRLVTDNNPEAVAVFVEQNDLLDFDTTMDENMLADLIINVYERQSDKPKFLRIFFHSIPVRQDRPF